MVLHFGITHRRLFYLMVRDRYNNYYNISQRLFPYEWHNYYKVLGKDWGGDPKPKVEPLGLGPGRPGMVLGAREKAKCQFGMVLYVDILGPVIEAVGKRCYVLAMQERRSKYALVDLIPNMEPRTVVEQLLVRWVQDFSFPRSF